jgi:hypothetical protein
MWKPLWIISATRTQLDGGLTLDPDLDGGFLAVFSYEEKAEEFLYLLGDDEKQKGWPVSRRRMEGWSRYCMGLVRRWKVWR